MKKGQAQRRMAAQLLKCGVNRVKFDKDASDRISTAITREDIRKLIAKGVIRANQRIGTGRFHARENIKAKRKGRARHEGSKKGAMHSIVPRKRNWINTIRPIRRFLLALKESKKLDSKTYRRLYKLAGGGFFRNKSHLRSYMEKEGIEAK